MLDAQIHPHTHPVASLDELARHDVGTLVRLFRESPPPRSVALLEHASRGRLLALGPPLDRVSGALRALTASAIFPWRGKHVRSQGEREGHGTNAFHLLGERFGFRIGFDRSVLDSERCVVLDYDLPENPAPIRRLRDELREAAPGLYFGPAFLRTGTEPKLLLFFALSAR